MVFSEYTWIFVCSIPLALFVAYGIGANDVANAFGSSVGAKALTMTQAVVVASICEFGGAVLLGAGVTSTIRSGIAKLEYYTAKPDLYMYGMLCVMLAAGIWLIVATFFELPVSTTHTIVGGIIGMSMVAAGIDSVVWSESKDSFPFLSGVSMIVISWFTSPILAGIAGAILFLFTRTVCLRRKNSYAISLWLLPFFTFIAVWVGTYYIIQKAPKLAGTVSDATNAWISCAVAGGCCLFAATVGIWLLKRKVNKEWEELEKPEDIPELQGQEDKPAGSSEDGTMKQSVGGDSPRTTPFDAPITDSAGVPHSPALEQTLSGTLPQGPQTLSGHMALITPSGRLPSMTASGRIPFPEPGDRIPFEGKVDALTSAAGKGAKKITGGILAAAMPTTQADIHKVIGEDETVHDIHASAEQFDRKTELSFKYLQVLTACANSFAHGSNDVANSIGPFAGIYAAWQCTCVSSKSSVPIWILVIGGVGMVVGLATYGYKIMRVLGVKMTKLTNSRGYAVELAAALVIIIGSRYGLPLSTTHCMVGAVTGIGLVEAVSGRPPEGAPKGKASFNWKLLIRFFFGWVATLVVAGITAAAFTAQVSKGGGWMVDLALPLFIAGQGCVMHRSKRGGGVAVLCDEQGIFSPSKDCTDERVNEVAMLNGTANAIASLLSASNIPVLVEAAAVIATACSSEMVPFPPVSFSPISLCTNTTMTELNGTTFSCPSF